MRLLLLRPIKTVEQPKLMSVYALVQTKIGHRFTPWATADCGGARLIKGIEVGLIREHAGTDQLASFLSALLGIPVRGKTGLRGFFNFEQERNSHRTGGFGSGELKCVFSC